MTEITSNGLLKAPEVKRLTPLERLTMIYDVVVSHQISQLRQDDVFIYNKSCYQIHSINLNTLMPNDHVRFYCYAVKEDNKVYSTVDGNLYI